MAVFFLSSKVEGQQLELAKDDPKKKKNVSPHKFSIFYEIDDLEKGESIKQLSEAGEMLN